MSLNWKQNGKHSAIGVENGTNGHKPSYGFGPIVVDTMARTVTRNGTEEHLAERPFDILIDLLENRNRVLSRSELLDRFWDGHEVYDDALRKSVASIRKAIGDTSRPPRFIETRYGGGYRFIGEVEVHPATTASLRPVKSKVEARSASLVRPLAISFSILLLALLTVGFYVLGRNSQTPGSSDQTSPVSRIKKIAVMPLRNLTGKAENEYFSDGVTDSIITELARARDLKIISRTSSFSYKGREIDPREIGRELGVDALLEGTIQEKGKAVNIRVRLIDSSDGSILWTSNDFERQLTEASDLQDIIACSVAAELRTELCEKGAVQHTKSGLAYQEFLKGQFEWNKRTTAGIAKSIEHYKLAIQLDPSYSKAFAGLSESYSMGLWYVPFTTEFAVPKATEAARKAIELDPASAAAHTALASVSLLAWNWDEAGASIRRAIELDPNYARAYHVNAFYLSAMRRYEEAIEAIKRAHDLDPKNLVIRADTANILLHGHHADPARVDLAIAECDKLIENEPGYAETYDYRATAYLLKGNSNQFFADVMEGKRKRGERSLDRFSAAFTSSGSRGILRELLAEELKGGSRTNPKSMRIAAIHASLRNENEAMRWLTRAVDEGSAEIIALSQNPWFDSLGNKAEFSQLLERTGLPLR